MKKMNLLTAAALIAVFGTNCAFAKAYVKDFAVEYDEPLCVLETDYITMEVNGIEVEDDWLVIDSLITNSNAKRGYEVSVTRAAVDGIELYSTFSEDVDAEDECDEPIEFDLSDVIDYTEMTDFTVIELAVAIEDDDMELVYEDTIRIYPYGEDKSAKYERAAQSSDIVITDDEKFKISVTEFEYVEGWGYSIHMFVENHMDETIVLEGEDFKLNDADADTWYDDIVGGNCVNFSRLEWSQSDLDDAEVEEVEKIAFNLNIYDAEMDNLLYATTVVLEP